MGSGHDDHDHLQISVDDVLLMAILDTLQHLLHTRAVNTSVCVCGGQGTECVCMWLTWRPSHCKTLWLLSHQTTLPRSPWRRTHTHSDTSVQPV